LIKINGEKFFDDKKNSKIKTNLQTSEQTTKYLPIPMYLYNLFVVDTHLYNMAMGRGQGAIFKYFSFLIDSTLNINILKAHL